VGYKIENEVGGACSTYGGRESSNKKPGIPIQAVLRLVGHIAKANRNITYDILFSCLEIFDKLTERGT
jgi:hypothetical protein